MPHSIRELLREYLGRTRETQSEFARRTGISTALISKLLSGSRSTVGRSTVPKLAGGLNIPAEQILEAVRKTRTAHQETVADRPEAGLPIPTWRNRLHPRTIPLVGREPDRRRLSQWMGEPGAPCMVMTAEPGTGKTTVANVWMEEDVLQRQIDTHGDAPPLGFPLEPAVRPHRLLQWTFSREPGDLERCVTHLLAFLDGSETTSTASLVHRIDTLVRRIDTDHLLLVLDGIDTLEDAEDEAARQFVGQLPGLTSGSKVLVIGRCIPPALNHGTGELMAGCRHGRLAPLGEEDSFQMLRQLGINDTAQRMAVLSEECGGNARLLVEAASHCKFGPIEMPVPDDLRDMQIHLGHVLDAMFAERDGALTQNAIRLAQHLADGMIDEEDTPIDVLCGDETLLPKMTHRDGDLPRQVYEAANCLAAAGVATYDNATQTLELGSAFRRWILHELTPSERHRRTE